jgi:hypothetical protein
VVLPDSHRIPRVPWYSGYCWRSFDFIYRTFTFFGVLSQNTSIISKTTVSQSTTPTCSQAGLGSFRFARRYLGNRCFFLLLQVLRCFSSLRSPCMAMDSPYSDLGFPSRVSPFGYLWIFGCLRLPKAFRSLPRPSSALGA